jgi:regulator of chromosome condensation
MWGSAECDQYDARDKEGDEMPECKRPFAIIGLESLRIIDISCGGMHTLFLSD